jgi:hypothetical protein
MQKAHHTHYLQVPGAAQSFVVCTVQAYMQAVHRQAVAMAAGLQAHQLMEISLQSTVGTTIYFICYRYA